MADADLLDIDGIETCYGLSQVLFGLSLSIKNGEMVSLMGRNGMGKTTTIRSIMGLTPARAGMIGARRLRSSAKIASRIRSERGRKSISRGRSPNRPESLRGFRSRQRQRPIRYQLPACRMSR